MNIELTPRRRLNWMAGAATLLAGVALSSLSAQAGGTAAGTIVENTVTVNYSVGGQTQTPVQAVETFNVDRMIDVQVTGIDDTVVPGETETTAVLVYTVQNQGNATQGYDLNVSYTNNGLSLSLSGDAIIDPGEYGLFIDSNGNGVYDDGVDTFYNPTGTSNAFDLIADQTITVFIVAHIPVASTDGQSASFDLVATTLDQGTATVTAETANPTLDTTDVVFVDDGGSIDVATDGTHSAKATFTVSSSNLVVSKTASVINATGTSCATAAPVPANEQFAIPGACIEYVITVINQVGATGNATNVQVVDALPGEVTFVAFTDASNLTFSNESGDVAPAHVSGTVSATEAVLAPGESVELVIRTTVN